MGTDGSVEPKQAAVKFSLIELDSMLLRIMGICGSCCTKPNDDHELVPIRRHSVWPCKTRVATNLHQHEFFVGDLTSDTR